MPLVLKLDLGDSFVCRDSDGSETLITVHRIHKGGGVNGSGSVRVKISGKGKIIRVRQWRGGREEKPSGQ